MGDLATGYSIKSLAKTAKARLRRNGIQEEKGKFVNMGCLAKPYATNKSVQSERKKNDENFYKKVKGILDKNPNVLNPVAQMMDKELFEKLGDVAKQKYVITLSKKYVEFKERYFKELSESTPKT